MSSSGILRFDLLPDPGRDVLGDVEAVFDEVFDPLLAMSDSGLGLQLPEMSDQDNSQLYKTGPHANKRVHYVVLDGTPFLPESLSPPPAHLTLHSQNVHLQSLEHYVCTSVSSLFCAVSYHEMGILHPWLCDFFQRQPSESPLQSLAISVDFNEIHGSLMQLFSALAHPSCKIVDLCLRFSISSALHEPLASNYFEAFQLWLEKFRSRQRCRFWLYWDAKKSSSAQQDTALVNCITHTLKALEPPSFSQLLEFKCSCIADSKELFSLVCAAIKHESCRFRRLDIRGSLLGNSMISADMMSLLLECVASSEIQDLGISLGATRLSYEQNEACCSVFADAFTSSKLSVTQIKTLRTEIDTTVAAACVAEILISSAERPQNRKVRFLEVNMKSTALSRFQPFFRCLREGKADIECLRAQMFIQSSNYRKLVLSDLSNFLSWKNCPLLSLHFHLRGIGKAVNRDDDIESLELMVANALRHNYLLTSFSFPWESTAAKSRAAAFLARNQLYKYGDLSGEQRVKPTAARLFLCGHGEVGKTTVRKALIKLNAKHNPSASFKCPHVCCSRAEPRTRGLEIHRLEWSQAQKLIIYDLAGQPDYHVFHHFFISNTSNDLFIIVCKYSKSDLSKLSSELEYWLRFINSHRNYVSGPNPKVILIVNFFDLKNRESPQVMQANAEDITKYLKQKYSEVLDMDNVFGMNAMSSEQVKPLLQTLERLVGNLLEERPKILQICHDLSTRILPPLIQKAQSIHRKKPMLCGSLKREQDHIEVMLPFSKLVDQYILSQGASGKLQAVEVERCALEKRILAALVELHDMGEVVFFPSNKTSGNTSEASSPAGQSTAKSSVSSQRNFIITNPNWFCNKVMGDLLEPQDWKGKCHRNKLEVIQMIKQKDCPRESAEEIFGYMQDFEFCYIISAALEKDETKIQVFFPAVTTNERVEWPPGFNELQGNVGNDTNMIHFFGRRLKCKDEEKQLIPSGVFTRLQVKLRNFCGLGANLSFKMGYHWASFVKDGVGVLVRFGGSYAAAAHDDHAARAIQKALAGKMKIDNDHPECIDILLCCPYEDAPKFQELVGNPSQSKADIIMDSIKHLIFEICQATSRSIPTVELQEWILRNKDDGQQDVIPMADLKEIIATGGLHGSVSWTNQGSTPVVELLLPKELQNYVISHIEAMQQIEAEFGQLQVTRSPTDDQELRIKEEVSDAYHQLPDDLKVFYDLLSKVLLEKIGDRIEELLILVKDTRKDIQKLKQAMSQMQVNILANCSISVLTEVTDGGLPAYAYMCNTESGKFEQLRTLLLCRKAKLHFLCESRSGLHEVEGQPGVDVLVERGLLIRAAPVLVPALKVMCCAARFAANVYLPGIAPAIFSPLLEMLNSLGITSQDLQSEIMPKALHGLFSGIDEGTHLLQKQRELPIGKDQIDAVKELLQGVNDLDMHKDFGLYLVKLHAGSQVDAERAHTRWVCKAHTRGHTILNQKNPFAS